MDDDKVAALRAKLAARKVPTAKKAAVKKLAAKSRARVVEAEEPAGQVLGRVIRGTTSTWPTWWQRSPSPPPTPG